MNAALPARLHRWLPRLGLPGAAGLGLSALGLAFYLSAVRPMEERLAAAGATAGRLSDRLQQAGLARQAGQPSAGDQLDRFYRLFPGEREAVDVIARIVAIGQDDGLLLDQGEYRTSLEKAGGLLRLRMALPVKGEYPQIRRFLDDVQAGIPAVSLERIQIQRQKVGDPVVDADIRLALFLVRS